MKITTRSSHAHGELSRHTSGHKSVQRTVLKEDPSRVGTRHTPNTISTRHKEVVRKSISSSEGGRTGPAAHRQLINGRNSSGGRAIQISGNNSATVRLAIISDSTRALTGIKRHQASRSIIKVGGVLAARRGTRLDVEQIIAARKGVKMTVASEMEGENTMPRIETEENGGQRDSQNTHKNLEKKKNARKKRLRL